MQMGLKDKVVLVTGGLRGIGLAITQACAAAGAKVMATYVSQEAVAFQRVEQLRGSGLSVEASRLDVRDPDGVSRLFEALESRHGRLDVLVNNAGIAKDNLLLGMEDDEWRDVIDTNLNGVFHVTRAAAKLMLRMRRGAIVNVSSAAASKPGRGHSNYAASKGGVESMTKALAVELGAKGIRVNAVAPGVIVTDMSQRVRDAASDRILDAIVLKRFGSSEEVANLVLFLASDASSYITGQVILIDGGLKL